MSLDPSNVYLESLKEKVTEHSVLLKGMAERLVKLESRNGVDDFRNTSIDTRLSAIEDILKWLVRLIIGAIILGGLSFILKGGFYAGV